MSHFITKVQNITECIDDTKWKITSTSDFVRLVGESWFRTKALERSEMSAICDVHQEEVE